MKKKYLFIFLICFLDVNSQETLPIYQDYLSDNVYLVHPTAAGIGECGKIRLTARTQWLGIKNAPQLQTINFHSKLKRDSKVGYGITLFNDKNGYHSQKGIQGAYAYHLEIGNGVVFNQLSFGLSLNGIFNQVDQRGFVNDPAIKQIIESDFYFNSDIGIAYHLGGFSSYLTVKNILVTGKSKLKSEYDALNLRNYILGVGYFFGNKSKLQFEPSLMLQYKEQTSTKLLDLNFKAYKKIASAQFWAAVSYRQSFDSKVVENARYISPILGFNFNKFMFSYTYTNQLNKIKLTPSGFHQISLGLNIMCRERRLSACPNINASF